MRLSSLRDFPAARGAEGTPDDERNPRLRLFLFHHAGGSRLTYRRWVRQFPGDWQIHAMEAPGRGFLRGQPACDDFSGLVDRLLTELLPQLDRPFALFGHSMGGLVAHELAHRLCTRGLPAPVWVGVCAPPKPTDDALRTRALQSDDALRTWLQKVGGLQEEIVRSRVLWQRVSSAIRHDLTLIRDWQSDREPPRLAVPLSCFAGTDDVLAPPRSMTAWRHRTTRFLGLHVYPGHHFFLHDHRVDVIRQVVAEVRSVHPPGEARTDPGHSRCQPHGRPAAPPPQPR